jgi:predicted MFS family arabinose efflux permease
MQLLSSRSSWLIALGLSLGPAVSNGVARFAYGLVLPAMREDLSWSYTDAGWINTANAVGYLIGALLALRFVATVGPRRMFIGGMVLTTASLMASALTRDFWLLSLWRILAGVGGAPAFIGGGAMASTLFKGDASRNALAIAIYFVGGGLGMLLTGLPIPLILETIGIGAWPMTWLLMAALGALATVPAVFAARSVPLSLQSSGGASGQPLSVSRMTAGLIGYFLFAVGYIVYLTFLVAWMRAQGAGAPLVAATWSILGIAVMLSPFPWRGILAKATGGGTLALACAATGVGTLLPLIVADIGGILLSAALFGVSFFIGPTSVTAFSRKNLPEASWGRSVALFTTTFAVGQTIGPVAAGLIADITKSLTLGLLAAGLALLLAAVVASFQRPLIR